MYKKNKTGVKYINTEYIVRNQTKEIICKLNFEVHIPEILAEYSYLPYKITNKFDLEIYKKLTNSNIAYYNDANNNTIFVSTVYGYANCKPENEFDTVFGKRLAQTRAQKKAFKTACKIYDILKETYENISYNMSIIRDNCSLSYNNCLNHSNELIDNKYNN